MNIKDLCKEAHEIAVEKKWYEKDRSILELLMLIVSELGEACEAVRKNKRSPSFEINDFCDMNIHSSNFEKHVKDTFEDEIADVFIRLTDMCDYLNINIEKHIRLKMDYNKTRSDRHGGKLY